MWYTSWHIVVQFVSDLWHISQHTFKRNQTSQLKQTELLSRQWKSRAQTLSCMRHIYPHRYIHFYADHHLVVMKGSLTSMLHDLLFKCSSMLCNCSSHTEYKLHMIHLSAKDLQVDGQIRIAPMIWNARHIRWGPSFHIFLCDHQVINVLFCGWAMSVVSNTLYVVCWTMVTPARHTCFQDAYL